MDTTDKNIDKIIFNAPFADNECGIPEMCELINALRYERNEAKINGDLEIKRPISVSISDAINLSGLSKTTIYEALNSGGIRAHKSGRRTIIPFSSLEDYLMGLPERKCQSSSDCNLPSPKI